MGHEGYMGGYDYISTDYLMEGEKGERWDEQMIGDDDT